MEQPTTPKESVTPPSESPKSSPRKSSPKDRSKFDSAGRRISDSQEWKPPSRSPERRAKRVASQNEPPPTTTELQRSTSNTSARSNRSNRSRNKGGANDTSQMSTPPTSGVAQNGSPLGFRDSSGNAIIPVTSSPSQNVRTTIRRDKHIADLEQDLEEKSLKLEKAEAIINDLQDHHEKTRQEITTMKHNLTNLNSENQLFTDRLELAEYSRQEHIEAENQAKLELADALNSVADLHVKIKQKDDMIAQLQQDAERAEAKEIELEKQASSRIEAYKKENDELLADLQEQEKVLSIWIEQEKEREKDLWRHHIESGLVSSTVSVRGQGLLGEVGSGAFGNSAAGSSMSGFEGGHSRTGSRVSGINVGGGFEVPPKSALKGIGSGRLQNSYSEQIQHLRQHHLRQQSVDSSTFGKGRIVEMKWPGTAPPRKTRFANDQTASPENIFSFSEGGRRNAEAPTSTPLVSSLADVLTQRKVREAPVVDKGIQANIPFACHHCGMLADQVSNLSHHVIKPLRIRPQVGNEAQATSADALEGAPDNAGSAPLPSANSTSESEASGTGLTKMLKDLVAEAKTGTSPEPNDSADTATQTTPTSLFTHKLPLPGYQESSTQTEPPSSADTSLPTLPASIYGDAEDNEEDSQAVKVKDFAQKSYAPLYIDRGVQPDHELSVDTSVQTTGTDTDSRAYRYADAPSETAESKRADTQDMNANQNPLSQGERNMMDDLQHARPDQAVTGRNSSHAQPPTSQEQARTLDGNRNSLLGLMRSLASQISIPGLNYIAMGARVQFEQSAMEETPTRKVLVMHDSSSLRALPSPEYASQRPRSLGSRFLLQTTPDKTRPMVLFRDEEEAVSTPIALDMPSPRRFMFRDSDTMPDICSPLGKSPEPAGGADQELPVTDTVQNPVNGGKKRTRPSTHNEEIKIPVTSSSDPAEPDKYGDVAEENRRSVSLQLTGLETRNESQDSTVTGHEALSDEIEALETPTKVPKRTSAAGASSSIDMPRSPGLRRRQTGPVAGETMSRHNSPRVKTEAYETTSDTVPQESIEAKLRPDPQKEDDHRRSSQMCFCGETCNWRMDKRGGTFLISTLGYDKGGWWSLWTWVLLLWIVILACLSLQAYNKRYEWLSANVSRMNQVRDARMGWLNNDWMSKLRYQVQQKFDPVDWIYC